MIARTNTEKTGKSQTKNTKPLRPEPNWDEVDAYFNAKHKGKTWDQVVQEHEAAQKLL
jgi:hypothetical protein